MMMSMMMMILISNATLVVRGRCSVFFIYRRLPSLLNYQASALMGKSLFDYHHGGDSECLNAAFKCCKWGVIGIARVELCL